MNARRAFRTSLLAALVALGSAGCDNSNSNMSQEDVQFLSHLDQARFFQRQGELKASTLEARSAMDLQPQRADPYFIMIDNLLTAGDAINAERQLKRLRDNIEAGDDNIVLHNRVRLALARAAYMQRQHDQAIEILGTLQNPDRTQQLEIATLTGDILLAQRKLDEAVKAYDAARQIDAQAIMPVLGLSRTALTA
ncbi:MAG: tetratricopeptide repeat protein, partial [Gammaproteobacteria bacterium]|nr:tetratricopeptide repeat protein [Gammaproteobacteria bacterium]